MNDRDRSLSEGGMGSRTSFRIDVRHPAARVVLLRVKGEVDVWTSLPLMESLVDAQAENPELIAVDLSDVSFMDEAGLQTLKEGARLLEDATAHLAVVLPSDHELSHLPQLAGLHRVLNVHESTDEALGPWLDETGEGVR